MERHRRDPRRGRRRGRVGEARRRLLRGEAVLRRGGGLAAVPQLDPGARAVRRAGGALPLHDPGHVRPGVLREDLQLQVWHE